MVTGNRYLPLLRYLAALPPPADHIRLRRSELEALVGRLPARAERPRYWSASAVAHRNWQFIHFSARLQPTTGAITFTRRRRRG